MCWSTFVFAMSTMYWSPFIHSMTLKPSRSRTFACALPETTSRTSPVMLYCRDLIWWLINTNDKDKSDTFRNNIWSKLIKCQQKILSCTFMIWILKNYKLCTITDVSMTKSRMSVQYYFCCFYFFVVFSFIKSLSKGLMYSNVKHKTSILQDFSL